MSYPLRNDALTLYAITDRYWLNGRRLADVVENVLKNGATFLQLREKEFSHEEMVQEAMEIKEIAARYQVPFVINDDIYAAKEIDADGVHIGQSDMDIRKPDKSSDRIRSSVFPPPHSRKRLPPRRQVQTISASVPYSQPIRRQIIPRLP